MVHERSGPDERRADWRRHGMESHRISLKLPSKAVAQMFNCRYRLQLNSILILTSACCITPLWAQARVSIVLDNLDTSKLIQTQDYSFSLNGTVSAPGGLATMYTVDARGNRGEVAFRLTDAASGSYSFSAGPVALRPGINRITVAAVDRSNTPSSAEVSVLSNRAAPAPPETRTGRWMGRQVTVQLKDGMVLFEGDMILGTTADFEREQAALVLPDSLSKNPARNSLTTAFTSSLWPTVSGVVKVPYQVTNSSANMNSAIASFNSTFSGLIQWVPRAAEADYVNINLNPSDHSYGCAATLGRTGGAQSLSGSIDCLTPTLLHEMGHAIGLYHQHQRQDYPTYVTYNTANIDAPIQPGNFGFVTGNSQPAGLYDYSSIMHYGAFTFSKNNQPVMETIPAGMPIGESNDFSAGDIDQIKRLYAAAPTQVTVTTNPPGLPIVVDSITYTAPHAFAWSIGSSHTIGAPSGYQTIADGAKYSFGNWNDSGSQSHSITVNAGSGARVAPASSPAVTVYVASYQRYNQITTQAFGSGAVQLSPLPTLISGNNYYLSRTAVSATAAPNAGNVFTKWYGNDYQPEGQNPKPYLISDIAYAIQAQFAATTPVYTISSGFTNNTPRNPPVTAIVDGNTVVIPVNFTSADGWTTGSSHTLNLANPQSPVTTNIAYKFSTWNFGGSPAAALQNITLPGSSTTYTATFRPSYRGYAIVSPSCAATAPNPLVTDQNYDDGTIVNFQVNPISSWLFAGFSGSLTGLTNPQSLTVHDQFIVTANLNTVSTPLAITGFTPASITQGASTQYVTIVGTGFTSSTIVFVNGSYGSGRSVLHTDSQHLQVQLSPADLTASGGFPIGVQNSANSCSVYVENTFLVNNPAASPSSITANTGTTPQSAAAGTAFANALAVTVRDASSNPVSGVNITFTAPGSGPSGTFGNGTTTITLATNASGIASAPFTANGLAGGPYMVTATSAGLTTLNFSLTNLDVTAPTVAITTPVSTATYNTSNSTLNLGGTASDNTGVTQVTWSCDRCGSGIASGTSSWNISGITLLSGVNVITVTARDAANNPATATITVTRTTSVSPGFDFNADGKSDVLWQNPSTGDLWVWLMNGAALTGTAALSGSTTWRVPAVADFNGDGKPDILWQNPSTGDLWVWYMNGITQTGAAPLAGATTWRIVGTGDFNSDGKPDILWQEPTTGDLWVWYMNGSAQTGSGPLGGATTWKVVGAADINGDGKPDILWQNPSTGDLWVWYMNGTAQTGSAPLGGATAWRVVGTGDFNGDGKTDVLWQQPATGDLWATFMNGAVQTGAAPLGGATSWKAIGAR
jgi:hypothetical protein